MDRRVIISKIKILSNSLDSYYYNELNFRNHCYLRIAFDNTINQKWDLKIKRPFIKHASENQLNNVLLLLNRYFSDKQLLLADNQKSLIYRQKSKQLDATNNLELF